MGAACGTGRPSAVLGAGTPVRQSITSPNAGRRSPPKVTSSAAAPASLPTRRQPQEVRRDVCGARATDPDGEVTEPAEVLHRRQRPRLDDLDAADHRCTCVNHGRSRHEQRWGVPLGIPEHGPTRTRTTPSSAD